jgi:hypothetical protein
MATPTLVRCGSCSYYVRLKDASCPFCGASRQARPDPRAEIRPLTMRMSRSAAWAIGVPALALATSACGGNVTSVENGDAAGEASPDPRRDDAGRHADAQGISEDGGSADAQEAADAADDHNPPPDAHNTCDVFIAVDYGLPPCR